MRADQQRNLSISCPFDEGPETVISHIGHDDNMRRRNCEHIQQYSIYMIITESITVDYNDSVWSTGSGCEITKQLGIRILGCLHVFRRIWIDHDRIDGLLRNVRMVHARSEWDSLAIYPPFLTIEEPI